VMASLAWTLKAWFALSLPETGRWATKYKSEKRTVLRMEFKTFLNAFMRVPCQIVRGGETDHLSPPGLEPMANRVPARRGCLVSPDAMLTRHT